MLKRDDVVFNVKAPPPPPPPEWDGHGGKTKDGLPVQKRDPLRPPAAGGVAARFVAFDELRAHGRLPRLGSNAKYAHPTTGETNANLCRHRDEFPEATTIFIFVSHEWAVAEEDPEIAAKRELLSLPGEVRAAAATKHRDKWAGMTWGQKLEAAGKISNSEVSSETLRRAAIVKKSAARAKGAPSEAHPDDANRAKFGLIVAAIQALRNGGSERAPLPAKTKVALWIDWCCLDQDRLDKPPRARDKRHLAEVQGLGTAILAQCDALLTPIIDANHASWRYPAVWKPHGGISQAAAIANSGGKAKQPKHRRVSNVVGLDAGGASSAQLDALAEEEEEDDDDDDARQRRQAADRISAVRRGQLARRQSTSTRAPRSSKERLLRRTSKETMEAPELRRGSVGASGRLGGQLGGGGGDEQAGEEGDEGEREQSAPLWQYAARGWAGYWARAWCGTEALLGAALPLASDADGAPDRARLVGGCLHAALSHGRRAHLVFGSKEKAGGLPPLQLPVLLGAVLKEWAPSEGALGREHDRATVRQLAESARAHMGRDEEEGFQPGQTPGPQGNIKLARYVNPDGSWVQGPFVKAQLEGDGACVFASGEAYRGQFNGATMARTRAYGVDYGQAKIMKANRHGFGKQICANGDLFEGQFEHDKRCGRGHCAYAMGGFYAGEWREEKRHGEGMQTDANGDVYEGQWVAGVRCGQGRMRYDSEMVGEDGHHDGDVYVGEWEGDVRHGVGAQAYADGSCYEGQWHSGVRHGTGTQLDTPSHDSLAGGHWDGWYVGQWFNGERHGQGVLHGVKDRYVGEMQADHPHGYGTWYALGAAPQPPRPEKLVMYADGPPPTKRNDKKEAEAEKEQKTGAMALAKAIGARKGPSLRQALNESVEVDRLVRGDEPTKEKTSVWEAMASWTDGGGGGGGGDDDEFDHAAGVGLAAVAEEQESAEAIAAREAAEKEAAEKAAAEKAAAEKAEADKAKAATDLQRIQRGKTGRGKSAEKRAAAEAARKLVAEKAAEEAEERAEREAADRTRLAAAARAGQVYEGMHAEGARHGAGRLSYGDGEVSDGTIPIGGGTYEATWELGVARGEGRFVSALGGVFEGQFFDEMFDGYGRYTFGTNELDGGEYVGQWREGREHGKGRRAYSSCAFYEGEWRDGLPHGRGVQFLPSGLTYEGEWKEGGKHGRGRQRRCPAAADTIEDASRAAAAMGHLRKGMAKTVAFDPASERAGADGGGANPFGTRRMNPLLSKWKPVGQAFLASAKDQKMQTALDTVLAEPNGVPDTRAALFSLLGMGIIVHEGQWSNNAPAGEATQVEPAFYREVRGSLGLAKWECGKL